MKNNLIDTGQNLVTNKLWGRNVLAVILLAQNVTNKADYKKTIKPKLDGFY